MKTDVEIQKDVLEELRWEPSLEAAEVGVAVKNGIVTLSGTLPSYYKKLAAEKAARRVAGVKAVAEDIEVRYPSALVKTDSEIAAEVINTLKWHSAIDEGRIRVKVEDGYVTLDGEVEWEYQKRSAKSAIEGLTGVRGIIDQVAIRAAVQPSELKRHISAALHRSATLDADKISVEVKGDKAILSGKVRSWAERNDAERAVWNGRGIARVENKLEVESGIYAL